MTLLRRYREILRSFGACQFGGSPDSQPAARKKHDTAKDRYSAKTEELNGSRRNNAGAR